MVYKKMRPAPAVQSGPGLGIGNSSPASSGSEFTLRTHSDQARFAVDMIAGRFRVSRATALANAEAFGLACLS